MDTNQADALRQALAPAMQWEALPRDRPHYRFRTFVHAPLFRCDHPQQLNGPGSTMCLRLQLEHACVPETVRLRLRMLAPERLGTDGCLYLLADATRSQRQNKKLVEDELARLVLG